MKKAKATGRGLDKAKADYEEYKADLAKAREEAMKTLTESTTYKAADQIQQDALVRELSKKFGEKQPTAPKPEELFGDVANMAKVMKELNELFDDANKSKDYLDEKYRKAKEALEANPTSEKLKENLRKAKAEVEEYKTKNIDEAIEKLKESDVYKNAKPEQQAKMEKYLTDKFLKSQTSKILPTKLFENVVEGKKITTTEKKAWAAQLKTWARGQKNAIEATKGMMKEITDKISELSKKGSITAKQADNIIKKMASLKITNEKGIDKFVDYVSKVFEDSEYNEKLSTANKLRTSLSKLAKDEGKNANLRDLVKRFKAIKPSMVEDIDAYNEMAAKIKESIAGSKVVSAEEGIKAADMVKIAEAKDYIDKVLEAQNKALYDDKLAEVQDAMGIDASELTYEQLVDLVKSEEPIDNTKKTIIKDMIKKMFDTNSAIIKHIFETGKDPFTDEPIEISAKDKELVKQFMDMDLDLFSEKESLECVDALSNFLQNESTAKMESVIRDYNGKKNAIDFAKTNIKAHPLKLYWNRSIGKLFGEQISTLPNLFERMFKSVRKGLKFEKASGMSEVRNAKTRVQVLSDLANAQYVKEFYKRKANGERFNTSFNIVERGMLADVRRTIIGTPEQQQKEFNRNKKIAKESVEALKNGSEKEQKIAEIYEKVYDKILKDSENIEDVTRKSDVNNVESVKWWESKWDSIYDQLSDVSKNIYNKVLDKELFYTPRKFTRLTDKGEIKEAGTNESLFHTNNETLYKKKTGVLEEAENPTELPKDKNKEATMFRDYSFDRNNANSFYDALMDIHTAGPIRQMEAFFNSNEIKKIIPNQEDRSLLFNKSGDGRVQNFVRNIRGKEIVKTDEVSKFVRKLNVISGIGTASALGGILQPIKQTVPVMMNTIMNAGRIDLSTGFSPDKLAFLKDIGMGISVRGLESQAQISSINKIVDLAAKSKGQDALKLIEKANRMWLDVFLKHPDVFVAKASWISYYEKALRKQKINTKELDYSKHKVNEEAANYAQAMVDRQQNISDTDLQGNLFASKNAWAQVFTKTVMPFASFRLNQTMRMMSDLSTLGSKTSSFEDRVVAAKSLSGFGVEMLAFKLIAAGSSALLGTIAKALMGQDETEEEYNKRINNVYKTQISGTVSDVLSPIPFLDYPVVKSIDFIMSQAQDAADVNKEEKYSLYANDKTDIIKSLGTLGIAASKVSQIAEIISLSNTGEYKDDYGRIRHISESDREALKTIGIISLLSNFGLAPSEVNSISRYAVSYAKKKSSSVKGGQSDKQEVKDLLEGYDSKSDMERYDPVLYKKNFGKNSDYYKAHKDELDLKKEERDAERKEKDLEYNYAPKSKSKKGFGSEGFGGSNFGKKSEFGKSGFGNK